MYFSLLGKVFDTHQLCAEIDSVVQVVQVFIDFFPPALLSRCWQRSIKTFDYSRGIALSFSSIGVGFLHLEAALRGTRIHDCSVFLMNWPFSSL